MKTQNYGYLAAVVKDRMNELASLTKLEEALSAANVAEATVIEAQTKVSEAEGQLANLQLDLIAVQERVNVLIKEEAEINVFLNDANAEMVLYKKTLMEAADKEYKEQREADEARLAGYKAHVEGVMIDLGKQKDELEAKVATLQELYDKLKAV